MQLCDCCRVATSVAFSLLAPMGENVLVVMLSFVARLTLVVVKETHPLLHAMTC